MKIAFETICLLILMAILLDSCQEDDKLPPSPVYSNVMIYNGATEFYRETDSSHAFLYIDTTNSPKDYPAIKLRYNYVYPGPYTGIPSPVEYMAVKTGQRRFRFARSNGKKITDNIITLADHAYQTVYLSDSLSYFHVLVTSDTLVRLEQQANIRLINLSPDAGAVQLYLDTLAIAGVKSRGYKSVSGFWPVNPSDYIAIRIRSMEHPGMQMLIRKSIPLRAGSSYTIILRGYMKPPDSDPNKSINLSILINQ